MNPISVVELTDVEQRCRLRDFEILKVNYKMDLEPLLKAYYKIKDQYLFQIKDRNPLYRGISLQYIDADNPLYDGIQERSQGTAKIFHKYNEIAEKIPSFFSYLPFQIYRSRILDSYPRHRFIEHSDGPVRITFHLPLISHPECLFYINKKPYHLKSDGSIFLVNTSYPHWIENRSNQIRTHIIGNLSLMSFWPLTSDYLEKLNEYYHKIGSEGVKIIMSRFLNKNLASNLYCAKCNQKTSVLPILIEGKGEGLFQLLCKSCTSVHLAAL